MATSSDMEGDLVKALKALWSSLSIDNDVTGGLWWNNAPEEPSGPYAVIEGESHLKILSTSDGGLYRWDFIIHLFLDRPDAADGESSLKSLSTTVDQIVGKRLVVGGKNSEAISRLDDAIFPVGEDSEQVVQAQLKYKVVH